MANLTQKSKHLALVLRHDPASANLTLSPEGWVRVEDVARGTGITLEEIHEIVQTDKKGRYSIIFDGLNDLIRANQGHSAAEVDITFEKVIPPVVLFHGTTTEAWKTIQKQGLKPMSRQYVHLSHETGTAEIVAARRRKDTVILTVDAKQMVTDGVQFFRSDNGVYLVDAVPAKYLTQV